MRRAARRLSVGRTRCRAPPRRSSGQACSRGVSQASRRNDGRDGFLCPMFRMLRGQRDRARRSSPTSPDLPPTGLFGRSSPSVDHFLAYYGRWNRRPRRILAPAPFPPSVRMTRKGKDLVNRRPCPRRTGQVEGIRRSSSVARKDRRAAVAVGSVVGHRRGTEGAYAPRRAVMRASAVTPQSLGEGAWGCGSSPAPPSRKNRLRAMWRHRAASGLRCPRLDLGRHGRTRGAGATGGL